MTQNAVALPPELHACVNDFLAQANAMHANLKYDAISASILYASAGYNVHGIVEQDDAKYFSREQFVSYMTDLYRRMMVGPPQPIEATDTGASAE